MRVRNRSTGAAILLVASCALPDPDAYSTAAQDAGARPDDAMPPHAVVTNGDGSAPVVTGCAARANTFFCADFDADPFDVGMTTDKGAPGVLGPATTHVLSPPRSLTASLPQRGAGKPHAFLDRHLFDDTRSFRASWSVWIEGAGAQSAVDIGGVYRTAVYRSLSIRYEYGATDVSGKLRLFEYGNADGSSPQLVQFTDLGGATLGRFVRFAMLVTQTQTSSSVTVSIADTPVLSNHPIQLYRSSGETHFGAGIVSSDGPGEPIAVYVDDVVVELQ
jgi:hypothetical protein